MFNPFLDLKIHAPVLSKNPVSTLVEKLSRLVLIEYNCGPVDVLRDPNEIPVKVNGAPTPFMVKVKNADPLVAVFNTPLLAAIPALLPPEAPEYPDEAAVVVSNVVVPLLLPCAISLTITTDDVADGVAVLKFQVTFPDTVPIVMVLVVFKLLVHPVI